MEQNTELYVKLYQLNHLLKKTFIAENHQLDGIQNFNWGQGKILALLKAKDSLSTKEMSYLLGIRTSSLNESLAKLEKNGYITREPSLKDKRIILNKLTAKGQNLQRPHTKVADIFDCLDNQQQQAFKECLDLLLEKTNAKFEQIPGIKDQNAKKQELLAKLFQDPTTDFSCFNFMDELGSLDCPYHQ